MSRIKQILVKLASLEGTTRLISLSFAIGVFIGFSPFLGLHTLMALTLCVLTRLNKPALMIGAFLNLPWILVPYYTFATWLGTVILDMPGRSFPAQLGLTDIISREFLEWLFSQWVLLIPAFTGSLLLSAILALLAYKAAAVFLNRYRSSGLKMKNAMDS